MQELVADLVRRIGELLMQVPMPWRPSLLLFTTMLLLFWILCRPIAWLLLKPVPLILTWTGLLLMWPTGSLNTLLRSRTGWHLPGTSVYEGLVRGVVGLPYLVSTKSAQRLQSQWQSRRGRSLFTLASVALVPAGLWMAQPSLSGTIALPYVENGFGWWLALEQQFISPVYAGELPAPSTAPATPESTETLLIASAEATSPQPLCTAQGTVRGTGTTGLKLRQRPNGDRIDNIPDGTPVCIISPSQFEQNHEWVEVQVTLNGSEKTGWVALSFIQRAQ